MPLTEAFVTGTPAVCSAIPPLLEQAAGAALTFDPGSVEKIADLLERVWVDDELHDDLMARGRERAALCTWERALERFGFHYRRLGWEQVP
jgi:glycosyltransferase involved in cell wall biosynthesis